MAGGFGKAMSVKTLSGRRGVRKRGIWLRS